MRVHVLMMLPMYTLATAFRPQCEEADTGSEPVSWQRWQRQLLEQTRAHESVFAQGYYGIFHMAEPLLLARSTSKIARMGSGHGSKSWPNMSLHHLAELISES